MLQSKIPSEWDLDRVWKCLNGPLWNGFNLNVAVNKRNQKDSA